MLHPSMISALIAGLKEQFVDNGTPVIMATHSVTTVCLVDDAALFRVSRSGGRVDVLQITRSEAVAELSEGLATIDAGIENCGVGERYTHYHHVRGEEHAAP